MNIQNKPSGTRPNQGLSNTAEMRLMHEALASLHRASEGRAAQTAGAAFVQDDAMTLSLAANLPESAIVLNHGFVRPEADTFKKAAACYRQSGINRFFLSTSQEPSKTALSAAELVPARNWRIFRQSLTSPKPEMSTGLTVHQVSNGPAIAFANIVSDAFDLGPASRPMLACLPDAQGWYLFQAEIEGEVAGTGALFIAGGLAWTDFGATAPNHRNKGVQKTLLAHRIAFARQKGCREILTCTGESVPGEAQISYHNIIRSGFREAELLFNYTSA